MTPWTSCSLAPVIVFHMFRLHHLFFNQIPSRLHVVHCLSFHRCAPFHRPVNRWGIVWDSRDPSQSNKEAFPSDVYSYPDPRRHPVSPCFDLFPPTRSVSISSGRSIPSIFFLFKRPAPSGLGLGRPTATPDSDLPKGIRPARSSIHPRIQGMLPPHWSRWRALGRSHAPKAGRGAFEVQDRPTIPPSIGQRVLCATLPCPPSFIQTPRELRRTKRRESERSRGRSRSRGVLAGGGASVRSVRRGDAKGRRRWRRYGRRIGGRGRTSVVRDHPQPPRCSLANVECKTLPPRETVLMRPMPNTVSEVDRPGGHHRPDDCPFHMYRPRRRTKSGRCSPRSK